MDFDVLFIFKLIFNEYIMYQLHFFLFSTNDQNNKSRDFACISECFFSHKRKEILQQMDGMQKQNICHCIYFNIPHFFSQQFIKRFPLNCGSEEKNMSYIFFIWREEIKKRGFWCTTQEYIDKNSSITDDSYFIIPYKQRAPFNKETTTSKWTHHHLSIHSFIFF